MRKTKARVKSHTIEPRGIGDEEWAWLKDVCDWDNHPGMQIKCDLDLDATKSAFLQEDSQVGRLRRKQWRRRWVKARLNEAWCALYGSPKDAYPIKALQKGGEARVKAASNPDI